MARVKIFERKREKERPPERRIVSFHSSSVGMRPAGVGNSAQMVFEAELIFMLEESNTFGHAHLKMRFSEAEIRRMKTITESLLAEIEKMKPKESGEG